MNLEERDRLCNMELDRIIDMAGIIKDSANEGASQKSGALRQVAEQIIEFLKMIDSDADIQEIEGHINRGGARKIDSAG
jgi:hypothetical protein